jgi:hypothetical protein
MIIENANISLASERFFEVQEQETEELREWGVRPGQSRRRGPSSESLPANNALMVKLDKVSISREAMLEYQAGKSVKGNPDIKEVAPESDDGLDARYSELKKLIEAITGRPINIRRIDMDAEQGEAAPADNQQPPAVSEGTQPEQGWGMKYTYSKTHYESEQMTFSAAGNVSTADGRQIDFSLDLMMSRDYFSQESLEISAGEQLIDPLVINWSNSAAELSDMKFSFDLDADGAEESISNLKPGTGFLVFDKNNDGRVNNGNELFGPQTGDGFKELAAYDEDGNNWIDENDTVFTKLSLWRKNDENQDSMISLKEAGVGAVYLGNARTEFDLRGSSNELYGKIQSSGVYLKENGGVGLVQQLDLAV